jgi:hypothetical protein
MLIRLILDPADEHRSGANQMRQGLSFQEHSRRGNAYAAGVQDLGTDDYVVIEFGACEYRSGGQSLI